MIEIEDIRQELTEKWNRYGRNKDTTQLFGVSFICDEDTIFGKPNEYIQRELEWYDSQSLNINDIPPPIPKIWKSVASLDGFINSNYGWCIYSKENGKQFENVKRELENNPYSRRASMIYTRPSMHTDYAQDGMNDFICTSNVTYEMEDDLLHAVVQMRSNDAVFGYKNDYAWQKTVLDRLVDSLKPTYPGLFPGNIIWQVANFHVYARHYYLLHHYFCTGINHISKKEYDERYNK